MAVTTTYACDKCKCAKPKPDFLRDVGFCVARVGDHKSVIMTAQFCQACLAALGVPAQKSSPPSAPAPTTAQLLEDLIGAIANAAQEKTP
jgi:hypothetical protein